MTDHILDNRTETEKFLGDTRYLAFKLAPEYLQSEAYRMNTAWSNRVCIKCGKPVPINRPMAELLQFQATAECWECGGKYNASGTEEER